MLAIVVAHGSNGVIGREGELPWTLPSDLRRFRDLTIGGTVIMGRKTFQSLPAPHRPLRRRRNLVLSSNEDLDVGDAEIHTSFDEALNACDAECFVIGGGTVYEAALPHADRVYATHVESEPPGDVFFPELTTDDWHCVEQSDRLRENGHTFVFRTYDRAR